MYDRNRLSHRSVVVGELEITPLPRIERRSEVMHDLLAVDPRIEPAVAVRRPFHVIDEVIPAVLHDRADLPAPGSQRWRNAAAAGSPPHRPGNSPGPLSRYDESRTPRPTGQANFQ